MDDLDLDLLITFEIKHMRVLFSSVQICEEAPRHNDFDIMIEKSKFVTELYMAKKIPINYFDRLYNDIRNHLYSEDLGWKSDDMLFIGHKFISTVAKVILYTDPHLLMMLLLIKKSLLRL